MTLLNTSCTQIYSFDPYGNLTDAQRHLILGGEALLWSEQAGPENFESLAWCGSNVPSRSLSSSKLELNFFPVAGHALPLLPKFSGPAALWPTRSALSKKRYPACMTGDTALSAAASKQLPYSRTGALSDQGHVM